MTREEELNRYNALHYDEYDENCEVEFTFERDSYSEWLEHAILPKGKKRTLRGMRSSLENTMYFFEKYDTLSRQNFDLYKHMMLDDDYSMTTIHNRIMGLRVYVNFLAQKYNAPHLKGFNRCVLKSVAIQKKQFIDNVISRADYDFLIAQAKQDLKNPNVYLGIKIMGTTGLRKSELYQVKVEHIKHGYADIIGKGAKQRRVYFPKNARDEILEYLAKLGADSGYVIRRWKINTGSNERYYTATTRNDGKYEPMRSFDRLFNSQIERAGVKYGIAPELMHPHGFRHFFAKEFLKHRLDISLLADLLGHSSIEVTRIYLRMTSKEQADVVDEVVTW